MRFQSPKQAKIYREWSPKRKFWLADHPRCMVCGMGSTEVHEIFNGPLRMKSFVEVATWLATCTDCNQNRLTDKKAFPIEYQLAIKLICDPVNFDLVRCMTVCFPRRIHAADLLPAIQSILTGMDSCPLSLNL